MQSHIYTQAAKAEIDASKEDPSLFDAWVGDGPDSAASFGHLAEAVHAAYPLVVVKHFVHGYGRGLWDPAVRCVCVCDCVCVCARTRMCVWERGGGGSAGVLGWVGG